MLPTYKLMEKIGEAYDHAINERVDSFRDIDKELTSLIPLYVQHIAYSSQAVKSLNTVQISTLVTQIAKVALTGITLMGIAAIFLFIPFIEGAVSGFLTAITVGFGLLYSWKKIPVIRSIWESTGKIDAHSSNLYVSLSECIRSLEEIKAFQQATIPTVTEWERKGLWKEDQTEDDLEEATKSIDNFLKEMGDRNHYNEKEQDDEQ